MKVIGDKGRRDLEHDLRVCGIRPGFERGFVGVVLGKVRWDLSALTEPELERVRAVAGRVAEYESQARQQEADRVTLSNAEMISEGAKWLAT